MPHEANHVILPGVGTWTPRAYDFITEALERNGLDEEGRSAEHWRSAIRSLQLMQTDFATKKMYLPTITEWQVEVPQDGIIADNDDSEIVVLPEGTIDIVSATVHVEGTDILMRKIDYQQYSNIPFKETYRNRSYLYLHEMTEPQQIRLYYKPDRPYDLNFFLETRPKDVEQLGDTLETAPRWHEAICANLALRFAQKWNPERVAEMKAFSDEAVAKARKADNTRTKVRWSTGKII